MGKFEIKFFRGDDHETKFKFTKYNGPVDKMYFTVRDEERIVRMTKQLDNGITKDGEYYVITFVPDDTNSLPFGLIMLYDIEIIVNGKTYTIAKDMFTVDEDVTRPTEEV